MPTVSIEDGVIIIDAEGTSDSIALTYDEAQDLIDALDEALLALEELADSAKVTR